MLALAGAGARAGTRTCVHARVPMCMYICAHVRAFVGVYVCACGRAGERAYMRACEDAHVSVCA